MNSTLEEITAASPAVKARMAAEQKLSEAQAQEHEARAACAHAINLVRSAALARKTIALLKEQMAEPPAEFGKTAVGELESWLLQGAQGGLGRWRIAVQDHAGRMMLARYAPERIAELEKVAANSDAQLTDLCQRHRLDRDTVIAHAKNSSPETAPWIE